MEAREILAIRKKLIDAAVAVLEVSDMAEETGIYAPEAAELRGIYKRMMELFCAIKLEQAE